MVQARGSAVIEVGASPTAPATSLASEVAEALAGGAQEAEEEEEVAPAPTPAKTVFGFGTRKISKPAPVAAVEEEEEEEEGECGTHVLAPCTVANAKAGWEQAKARLTELQLARASCTAYSQREPAAHPSAEAPAAPAKKTIFGFGTRKISKPVAVVEEVEEEEEEEEGEGVCRWCGLLGGMAVELSTSSVCAWLLSSLRWLPVRLPFSDPH